jgi:hypothetical protein
VVNLLSPTMAKETRKTKSATHSSTGMTVRGGREITTAQARAVLKSKGKGGGKRSGATKASSEKQLMNFAMGGAIVGAATATLEKPGGFLAPDKLKDIPGGETLGSEGIIALAAHFIGKGKAGVLTNVRNAAAAMAVGAMVKTKMAHA